eukprot:scaffold8955_cov38-Tisochrysis_lutea.AAC.3
MLYAHKTDALRRVSGSCTDAPMTNNTEISLSPSAHTLPVRIENGNNAARPNQRANEAPV